MLVDLPPRSDGGVLDLLESIDGRLSDELFDETSDVDDDVEAENKWRP